MLNVSALPPTNHSIHLEAYGLRLRPVTVADAEFIIALRSHPRVQGNIGDTEVGLDPAPLAFGEVLEIRTPSSPGIPEILQKKNLPA